MQRGKTNIKCISYSNLHNIKIFLQLKTYTSKDLKIILIKKWNIYIQFHTSSVPWQPFMFGLGFPFGLLKIIIFTESGYQPHAQTLTWRPTLWYLGVFPQGSWQMPKTPSQPPCFGMLVVWLLSWELSILDDPTSSYTTVPCNTA